MPQLISVCHSTARTGLRKDPAILSNAMSYALGRTFFRNSSAFRTAKPAISLSK